MHRMYHALTAIALLIACQSTQAAPRPDDKPSGPAIVGQARSFNDLLDLTKTMVKTLGGDALYKEFEKNALAELDPKQLPGIDPTRPFGVYGIVKGKLEDCRGVLLLPVPSEKDFIDMLTAERIDVTKSETEPEVYNVSTPPQVTIQVSFRVHKKYAYVAFGGTDVLSEKNILDPRVVISAKEKGVAYLSLHLDRIPADAKKSLQLILRDRIEQLKEMIPDPELKDAFYSAEKLATRYMRMIFEEAKEIAIRIDADVKTGELVADVTVEGLPKSPLAETFAKRKPTMNAFASLAGDDYAQRLFVSGPLFADEAKEGFSKLIGWANKEFIGNLAQANSPAETLAFVAAGFKSLKATVESGKMDLAAALRGPNKAGFYTAVGAIHCLEGAQFEKAIREVIKNLPAADRAMFKFDAGKIGEIVVHEIDFSTVAEEIPTKIFGKGQTLYFAFTKKSLCVAYGPDGMKLMKEAINAKPGPAAVLDTTGNPKKLKDIMAKIMPPELQNGGRGLGWLETATGGLNLTVVGGDKLHIRLSYNVGTLMFFLMSAGVEGNAQVQPIPAPPVAIPRPARK